MATKLDSYLTKNFRSREFACRCRRPECDAKPMRPEFMQLLQQLRDLWNKPLKPTSGSRCGYWNGRVGGAPFSQHLQGNAADFWFEHPNETRRFVELAEKIGFPGIGHGMHLVHLDGRDGPKKRWEYPGR